MAVNACRRRDLGAEVPEPSRLRTRRTTPTLPTSAGTYPLRLGQSRDGFLYVPRKYDPAVAAPLAVLLHGAGRASSEWARPALEDIFGARGCVVLAPDSRGATWDTGMGGFGPDVAFIDRALAFVYARCNIDARRTMIGGFSDGGSYALSLGLANGDVFSGVVGLSPGYVAPAPRHGKPPIFMAHGTADRILPIDSTSRRIVPALRGDGYDVTYQEFDGPHAIVVDVVEKAVEWFMGKTAHG